MIKKLLSSIAFVAVFGIANSIAQCTPDVSCIMAPATYGICPDSTTGIPAGTVGVPYNTTLSVKVPADGTDFGFSTALIVSVDITSVTGLAPGLSYVCVPGSCSFPGSSNGCILISGTPTAVWNQQIVVNLMAHGTIFGAPASLPQTNQQYFSVVNPAASVESLDMTKFDVDQNSPNPFSGKSEILFSSVNPADVEFKVYNLLGSVVYSSKIKADKGINKIALDGNAFGAGVYMYSIKNGDKTITKRMIVSK